jgi:hypothetical protein
VLGAAHHMGGLDRNGTIVSIVSGVDGSGGAGRDLLVTLVALASVTTGGITAMVVVDAGAGSLLAVDIGGALDLLGWLALAGGVAVAAWIPGIGRRRRARHRRELVARVGDPVRLGGVWRRLLAAAWTARDQFAATVDGWQDSPLADRLADHQYMVDAVLEQCGVMARTGDDLGRQLRRFGTGRMRRDLWIEQWRDADGDRARALGSRIDDVERLRGQVRELHGRLEAQVHDLRAAAWRASALRSGQEIDRDATLRDLLADLAHLREGLAEADQRPPTAPHRAPPEPRESRGATDVDSAEDVGARSAPTARRGYHG